MAQTSWVVRDYDNDAISSASHPYFVGPAGDHNTAAGLLRVEMPIYFAGVLKNLSVYMNLVQFDAKVALHLDSADSALDVDPLTGITGQYENTTARVAATAASDVAYRHSVVSGSGSNRYTNAHYEFEPDGSRTISFMYAANQSFAFIFQNNSQVERTGIMGLTDDDGAQDRLNTQWEIREPGIVHGGKASIPVTTRSTDSEVKLGINGSPGSNILITLTGGMTGVFSDTSNTESVSEGDLINWRWENFTGGGSMTGDQISTNISRALECWEGSPDQLGATGQNDGLTYDNPPGSAWRGISATNAAETVTRSRQTFRRTDTDVTANTLGAGSQGQMWLHVDDSGPGGSPSLIQADAGMTGHFTSLNQHICEVGQRVAVRRTSTPTTSGAWSLVRFQCEESPEIAHPTELFWHMPIVHVEGGRAGG